MQSRSGNRSEHVQIEEVEVSNRSWEVVEAKLTLYKLATSHTNRPQLPVDKASCVHKTHGTTVTAKDKLESSNGLLLRHFFD